jgi:hypothetical protein
MSSFLTAKYSGQASSNWSGQLSSTSTSQPATLEQRIAQIVASSQPPPSSVDLSALVSTKKVRTETIESSSAASNAVNYSTTITDASVDLIGTRMAGHVAVKLAFSGGEMGTGGLSETNIPANGDAATIVFYTPYETDNIVITLTACNERAASSQAYITSYNRTGFTIRAMVATQLGNLYGGTEASWNYQVVATPY